MPTVTIHLKGTKGFISGTLSSEDFINLSKDLEEGTLDTYTLQIDETTKAIVPTDQIAYIEVQEQQ